MFLCAMWCDAYAYRQVGQSRGGGDFDHLQIELNHVYHAKLRSLRVPWGHAHVHMYTHMYMYMYKSGARAHVRMSSVAAQCLGWQGWHT